MIVNEGCIPDGWREREYEWEGDPLACGSYRAIKLLDKQMKVLERMLERRI